MRIPATQFRLLLEAVPGWADIPPTIRLRNSLKELLRRHGLRAVEAVEVPPVKTNTDQLESN